MEFKIITLCCRLRKEHTQKTGYTVHYVLHTAYCTNHTTHSTLHTSYNKIHTELCKLQAAHQFLGPVPSLYVSVN